MKPTELNTEAEIEALEGLCERLSGFEPGITLEWLDGALAALVAGPRTLLPAEWLPLVFGEAWPRAIADPEDEARSLDLLLRRCNAIADQLKPQRLFDAPDQLHLMPLIEVFDPAQRDELLARGELTPEEAADWPLTGEGWAIGFLELVDRLADDWQLPDEKSPAARELDAGLGCIELLAERDAARLQAETERLYPGQAMSRDALIDEACFAVQDLRCLWLEQNTRPAQRRVEKTPGRNDLCPCGSGKKYKKCHGAGPALH